MPTVYEVISYTHAHVLQEIERRWGRIKVTPKKDPEDDYEFRFFDKMMRQVPRGR